MLINMNGYSAERIVPNKKYDHNTQVKINIFYLRKSSKHRLPKLSKSQTCLRDCKFLRRIHFTPMLSHSRSKVNSINISGNLYSEKAFNWRSKLLPALKFNFLGKPYQIKILKYLMTLKKFNVYTTLLSRLAS